MKVYFGADDWPFTSYLALSKLMLPGVRAKTISVWRNDELR